MPRHWITTHWPHPDDLLPWNVYARESELTVASRLEPGDKVIFRESEHCINKETKKMVTHIRKIEGDDVQIIGLRRGAGTIVGVAEVSEKLTRIPGELPRYDYGTGGIWSHWVKCGPLTRCKGTKYSDMLTAIDLNPATPATKFVLYEIEDRDCVAQLSKLIGVTL